MQAPSPFPISALRPSSRTGSHTRQPAGEAPHMLGCALYAWSVPIGPRPSIG